MIWFIDVLAHCLVVSCAGFGITLCTLYTEDESLSFHSYFREAIDILLITDGALETTKLVRCVSSKLSSRAAWEIFYDLCCALT